MRITRPSFGRFAILLAAFCVAIVAAQSATLQSVENSQNAIVAQVMKRGASQQIHIVEVDAKSIDSIRQWPWSREHYARLLEQLNEAEVRSVVFDIEFQSRSTESADAEFARAIAASEASVVLPTFSQRASEQSNQFVDSLPIAELRENASLASASVRPDGDALVRRMVYGTITGDTPRPSMSAQLAGVSGAVDSSFAIDYSIAPSSIPRHSFIDIETGRFDKQQLAGKDILIGATAIELGDRYGVPTYGVIPGVTIQALAAETLLAGALRESGWVPLFIPALIFAILLSNARSYRRVPILLAVSLLSLVLVQFLAYHLARTAMAVMPAIALVVAAGAGQALRIARVQLRERSLQDAETGLPNGLAFLRSEQKDEHLVATAYIHDFDSIQTVLGKAEIQKFFDRFVERIESVLDAGKIYRTDTRILAWKHTNDHQALIDSFEKLAQDLKKPIEVAGKRVDVSLSFGIASALDLPAASLAAGVAAKEGKLWHAHEDAEAAIIEARVSLMGELDEAIEAGQLSVLYQPKLKLSSNKVESVEALVRWDHPERGYLRPDLFIPLAEESNRIESLTLFVLKSAIEDLQDWCREGIIMSAAVNISATLVGSKRFANAAIQLVEQAGIPRDRLIFEVTESATMRDFEAAIEILKRFREMGIRISMDDYGTGQSSLSYLQMLPLTELKIDRAFVQNAHVERSDALLVRSTIQLAHSLGLSVVGEGVEDKACLDFLRESACDYAQGYYISKPLAARDVVTRKDVERIGSPETQAEF